MCSLDFVNTIRFSSHLDGSYRRYIDIDEESEESKRICYCDSKALWVSMGRTISSMMTLPLIKGEGPEFRRLIDKLDQNLQVALNKPEIITHTRYGGANPNEEILTSRLFTVDEIRNHLSAIDEFIPRLYQGNLDDLEEDDDEEDEDELITEDE